MEKDGSGLKKAQKKNLERVLEKGQGQDACQRCNLKHLDAYEVSDAILDGIYVTDKEGRVLSTNKSFSQITGICSEEIIGRHIEDAWADKHFNSSDNIFFVLEAHDNLSLLSLVDENLQKKNIIRKPAPISMLVAQQKKPISVLTTTAFTNKTVLITGTPYFDEDGEITHILTILRDLTDLLHLKSRLDKAEQEKIDYLDALNQLKEVQADSGILGISPALEKVRKLIANVAKTDATVLITGATGSGKEVAASELVKNSRREKGPYIKINCAAIPESLLESELFGYEKGAFTGAQQKEKKGLFELANKGSLLLDEIGEMPILLQAKLLRVLQEREIRRVGGSVSIPVDVRVLAATNCSLQDLVKAGKFREDLYYRLNVIPLEIPPLSKRKEDIMLLAEHFLKRFNAKHERRKYFEKSAALVMEAYPWPGNVRELENLVERLTIIGDRCPIYGEDIMEILNIAPESLEGEGIKPRFLKDAVNQLEKQMIEEALSIHKTSYKAAEALGVNQSTIVRKAAALGIEL